MDRSHVNPVCQIVRCPLTVLDSNNFRSFPTKECKCIARWNDTHSVRFGGRYKLPKLPYLAARADLKLGALYETPATPLQEIDPSALDWEKISFTVGFTVPVSKDLSFNLMALHTLRSEFEVDSSALRTTNLLHDDQMKKEPDVAKGGLQTVSGNGKYRIDHRRFGVGMKVRY